HNTVPWGPTNVGPLNSPYRAVDPVYRAERTRYVVVENNSLETLNLFHGAEHVLAQNNVLHADNMPALTIVGYTTTLEHPVDAAVDEQANFHDPATWATFSQVRNEQYLNITLSSGYLVNMNGVTAGANVA